MTATMEQAPPPAGTLDEIRIARRAHPGWWFEQAIALPDNRLLGPALEAAMKEIVQNGTYQKILDKWGVGHLAHDSPDDVTLLTDPTQIS